MNTSCLFTYCDTIKSSDNQTIILIGRHAVNKQRYNFVVQDFFPFFGVELTEETMKRVLSLERKNMIIMHEMYNDDDPDKPFLGLNDEYVVVVYLANTRMVQQVRQYFKKTYQDDVKYTRVFRIRKNISSYFTIDNLEDVKRQKTVVVGHEKMYKINHRMVHGF